MYKNSEGYSDPTAGIAMSRMMKEYRQARKQAWIKENDVKSRKKIYVVSAYSGNVESHISAAIAACRYVIAHKGIPIASHILYAASGILDDRNPSERELGMMFGLALISLCDEVWVFGDISPGMKHEICEAKKAGKQIRFFKGAS